MGIESVEEALCGGRLRWFGRVERVEEVSWVKRNCTSISVESTVVEVEAGQRRHRQRF